MTGLGRSEGFALRLLEGEKSNKEKGEFNTLIIECCSAVQYNVVIGSDHICRDKRNLT